MRLCLAQVVTTRLTRAVCPYSSLEAVGRPALGPRHVGVGKDLGTAVLADVLGVVADQPVALASDTMLDLARRRELEAFLDAALGLELGHFRLLCAPREIPWDATLSNRHGMPSGRAIGFPMIWKARAYRLGEPRWQPTKAARSHRGGGTCPCRRWSAVRSTDASPRRWLLPRSRRRPRPSASSPSRG